ncbi:MAG: hypothetical protein J6Q36_06070 [Alistipes sp.]|nr:hypothetical protein [Alistipes sp.]
MARKCLLGLIALLFITYNAYGQLNTEVIVTLKGGREIKGTITEEIPGESITIKTTDGDVFIYRNSEIAKIYNPNLTAQKIAEKQRIEREKAEKKAEAKEARNALREELKLGNFKGYRGIIDVGYNICNSYHFSTNHRITASFINGINIGPHLYIGLGVGIESGIYHVYSISSDLYNDYNIDYDCNLKGTYQYSAFTIPVFLNMRTAFLKERRVSPYLSINAGYCIPLSKQVGMQRLYNNYINQYVYQPCYVDGSAIYLEPSLGLEFRIKQKSAISASFIAPMYIRKEVNMAEGKRFNISLGCKLGFSF